jgi:chemosensory pili system protein ChpA (sensor histidine kinase/response regulator)
VQSLYGFSPRQGDEAVGGDFSEFDPIELDRYSQLNLIIRSLNEISVDVNSIHATLMSLVGDFGGQVGKQQLTMRLMQEKLMRIRMTPMSSLSRMLFRTVRETARKLEKKASLVIIGEDVYMDRYVWTKITDPLMHMLRNALDHGIESPAERLAAGKPESGTIRLEADQRSRFVILRISDDGRGIDMARVKERIRSGGLAPDVEQLSEQELLEFLFHPSFTTRQDVGTISGRGIGLDVVRKNIQDLRGSVQLFTKPNQGVTFEIRIPFTLSVNRAVMVSVASRIFAVPLQDIQQVKRFAAGEVITDDGVFLRHGDMVIPVVNLGFCLQLEKLMTVRANPREGILAVLFYKEEKLCAVSIDEVVEQREIIVKSLGSHLTHVPGISGVTFTGSGELIPIVNLRELMDQQKPIAARGIEPASQAVLTEPLRVLIVDDSISVRHSVARLVEGQGWKQQQAVDGSDALVKLETFVPDVIILDIEMPKMNGYELKSTLNNDPALKDIPVVMLTSRSSEKHQQKAKELGVRHYMTKPYQEEAFIRMLESIQNRSIN